jgi:hypothetical protein
VKIDILTREVQEEVTVDNVTLDDLIEQMIRTQARAKTIQRLIAEKKLKRMAFYWLVVESKKLTNETRKFELRMRRIFEGWPKLPDL